VIGTRAADARRQQARKRLEGLGFQLPDPLASKGLYLSVRRQAGLLWVSGHTGRGPAGLCVAGVVGAEVSLAEAQDDARRAAVNLLAAVDGSPELDAGLGDVTAVLHLRVYVRATPDFTDHPAVGDAASALLREVLGPEVGAHARTAVGVASLPGGAAVELEAVLGCAG
jgi:enamine deaminase RidA (YjgF/YER057c/UK114 family)